METGQRIQAKARCDDEEVMVTASHLSKVTNRAACIIATHLALLGLANAQTATPKIITDDKTFHAYALYYPRPEYPSNLRRQGFAGAGVFLLRIRSDGTVQSAERLKSTGHVELDDVAKGAFLKWRFRPGPIEAKVPIQFKVPRGTPGWPFAR
jgi:TonB family protein